MKNKNINFRSLILCCFYFIFFSCVANEQIKNNQIDKNNLIEKKTNTSILSNQFFNKENRIEKVTVTGVGTNKDEAWNDCAKKAVTQVVGLYVVSEETINNDEFDEKIVSQSNAYIRNIKELNTKKDSDGLIYLEAEVEVEVSQLASTLKEMNIAVKDIDSKEFKITANSKFDYLSDTRNLIDNVVYIPFKNNERGPYSIKVKNFNPLEKYSGEISWTNYKVRESVNSGLLLPFVLTFQITLSEDYFRSVSKTFDSICDGKYDRAKDENSTSGQVRKIGGLLAVATTLVNPYAGLAVATATGLY